MFAELTTALADLTARRNQLQSSVRTHRDRLARLDQEIANVGGRRSKSWRRRPSGSAISTRWPPRWRPRRRTWRSRRPRRKAPRPPTSRPGRSWKPRARRSPKPTSGCSGSRPRRGRSRNWSIPRPRTCGRRSSTASASPRDLKRRWAPCSATISTRRSIRRRRCAGPMPASPTAIRRCPTASNRSPRTSTRRPNWRGAWRRSASSPRSAAPSWCRSSRPASGWCRGKATSGAGTALSPRPMRRPARRGGSPSGRGWSTSRPSWSRPASTPPPSARRWKPPKPS